jgi:hypothetical protein
LNARPAELHRQGLRNGRFAHAWSTGDGQQKGFGPLLYQWARTRSLRVSVFGQRAIHRIHAGMYLFCSAVEWN